MTIHTLSIHPVRSNLCTLIRSACLMLALVLIGAMAPAQAKTPSVWKPVTDFRVVGAEEDSREVQSILKLMDELLAASNEHELEGILRHYSPEFTSGDNLTLAEVRHLIEETWEVYPDIAYDSQVLEIRVNGDWATVESLDEASATVSNQEGLIDKPGTLQSRSRGMLYLRRIGKSWEITTDYTLYENAVILYGDAQDLKFDLSAPDQVFAGEAYSAQVSVDLPEGLVAIASIAKDPLVYPQKNPEDRFRSMSARNNILERVFDANRQNRNEVVTATIGLTQVSHDEEDRPMVRFRGIATVVKRVNVLPRLEEGELVPTDLVRHSAGGTIDLRDDTALDN